MTDERNVEVTRTPRGFGVYGDPIVTGYGEQVRVYESSAAESPHMWLDVTDSEGRSAAHLNEEQARELIGALQAWIDDVAAQRAVDGGRWLDISRADLLKIIREIYDERRGR